MPILTDQERIGTTLAGKYRLDRILGKGGMGTVFGAVHAWTDRDVAVKLLKADFATDAGVVQRFLQEAKAAASLKHPNVVDVLDMGHSDDGGVYLVLEYLRGEPLGERIARGPMLAVEALAILLPVVEALAVAHARGIVHRDLKPDNIFLAVDGRGQPVPKLLDFGIAKVIGSSSKTGTGHIVGTPLYMSPEQVRGQSDLGAASDVWSMGVVLFECLTGKVPFDAGTPTGVLMAIVTTTAPSVSSMGVDVPAEIAAVVDRALAADLAVRFRDARELGEALHAAGLSLPAMPRAADPTGASALVRASAEGTGDSGTSRAPTSTPVAWTTDSRAGELGSTSVEAAKATLPPWLLGTVALLVISGLAGVGGIVLSREAGETARLRSTTASTESAPSTPAQNRPAQTPQAAPAPAAPVVPALAQPAALALDAGIATAPVAGDAEVPGIVAHQNDGRGHDVGVASAPTGRVPHGARVGVRGPRTTPVVGSQTRAAPQPPAGSGTPRVRPTPPTGANGSLIID